MHTKYCHNAMTSWELILESSFVVLPPLVKGNIPSPSGELYNNNTDITAE